jgi:hypothetical protein
MSIWAKKKQRVRPGLPHVARALGVSAGGRGGFSFGGHRLSSLHRSADQSALTLMRGYLAASSLPKYSNPALAAARTPGGAR